MGSKLGKEPRSFLSGGAGAGCLQLEDGLVSTELSNKLPRFNAFPVELIDQTHDVGRW